MRWQRLCPHPFGWSYNTHRRRRFCRLCAHQQRRTRTGAWVAADIAEVFEPTFADQERRDIEEANARLRSYAGSRDTCSIEDQPDGPPDSKPPKDPPGYVDVPRSSDVNTYQTHSENGQPWYRCGACGDTGIVNHGSDHEVPCDCG